MAKNEEYFKIYNSVRDRTHIVTKKALELIQANPNELKKIEIIGQCDEFGNVFDEIATQNFLAKSKENEKIKAKEVKKVTKVKEGPKKKVELDEFDDPKGNVDYQPTKKQLEEKIKNDRIAKEHYEATKGDKLKQVITEPLQ